MNFDIWLLSRPWPLILRAPIVILYFGYLTYLAFPVRAGLFGISIPANYGTWFTNIHQLYLDHQELIANARKLYTAALGITSALDALEGIDGNDQAAFRNRWRKNLRVMLEAQIWFEVDERFMEGDQSVNQLVQDLLGLQLDGEGRAAIDPASIQTLALSLTADRQQWSQTLASAPIPNLPEWLVTEEDFANVMREFIDRPIELAYESPREWMARAATKRFFDKVSQNPLAYVECSGRSPCWSPFGLGEATPPERDWPEMLKLMYDQSQPLHSVLPLPSERGVFGGEAVDIDQYLHRRVCAALWLSLGASLEEKLTRLHAFFQRRCRDLMVATHDIQFLVRFLQNSVTPLSEWKVGESTTLALILATALSIDADGAAKTQGKMKSWVDGFVAKKAKIALDRAKEVKERLTALNAIFKELLEQIAKAREGHEEDPGIEAMVMTGHHAERILRSLTHNDVPIHAYVSSSVMMERLAGKVAVACGLGRHK